jgi:hypothetical protein
VSIPTPGPGQPGPLPSGGPPPSPPGPWASDNLPQHPMSGYAPVEIEQPPAIRNAVRLMYVGALLSLIGVLLTPLQTDAIRDAVEDSDASLTAGEVDTVVAFSIGMAVVSGLVGVGLWLWMAIKNGQGRSWARVVATVLGGVNIVLTLLSVAGGQATGLTIAVSLLGVALAAVIIVLLYRPESSRFYDFRSR